MTERLGERLQNINLWKFELEKVTIVNHHNLCHCDHHHHHYHHHHHHHHHHQQHRHQHQHRHKEKVTNEIITISVIINSDCKIWHLDFLMDHNARVPSGHEIWAQKGLVQHNTTFLCYLGFDQYRNPDINDKDNLVGQLSRPGGALETSKKEKFKRYVWNFYLFWETLSVKETVKVISNPLSFTW